MAGEFVHASAGTVLTQAEFEAIGLHVFNNQATGDLLYASSATQLSRLGIGNGVLYGTGGTPAWATTIAGMTLTTPVIASLYQAGGGGLISMPASAGADTICLLGATQTLTLKTFTTPVLASFYQDAGKTQLMTVPNTASDTLVTLAAIQELDNKTLDSSVAKGTWTVSGTWAIPAVTVNGTLTATGQTISTIASVTYGAAGLFYSTLDNSYVLFRGGGVGAGKGAMLELAGADNADTGSFYFYTSNAAKNANVQRLLINGNLDAAAGIIVLSNIIAFTPTGAGVISTGDAVNYWNDISFKTTTDRGCLGSFDNGVEMPDGRILSDLEALKSIQVHPTLQTVYGVPRLDYSSMPKAVYKPAPIADKDTYSIDKTRLWEAGEKMGDDGAELTALISIILGAIKELDGRVTVLGG